MTQRDDLVSRLNKLRLTAFRTNAETDRAAYFNAVSLAFQRDELVPATALEAKDAEMAKRDAFMKELSDALLRVRPLGGSELFVKRFGSYLADPAYCKAAIEERHEQYYSAMKDFVLQRKRADVAEARIAELERQLAERNGGRDAE